jgi:hypothetical protein
MAVPANTRLTFGGVQVREEDLSDIIYNISPMDTPFMSGAGKGSCSNTLFEWQKDELAAAAANQKLEGDDPASLAVVEPVKLTNHTQISEKAVQTSGTAEAVDWAGRKSSQAYQLAKRAKEIKRDMELMLTGEDVKVAGGAWLGDAVAADSNIIDGSAGPAAPIANAGDGTAVAAPAGADAVLTMDMVNECIQQVWEVLSLLIS